MQFKTKLGLVDIPNDEVLSAARAITLGEAAELRSEYAKLSAELEAEKADHADTQAKWNEALDVGLKVVKERDALRAEKHALRG
jgi:hypothetical protein